MEFTVLLKVKQDISELQFILILCQIDITHENMDISLICIYKKILNRKSYFQLSRKQYIRFWIFQLNNIFKYGKFQFNNIEKIREFHG